MGICCSWPVERIVVSQFHTSGAPRVESQAAQILKTNYYSLKQYASLFCDTGLFTWRWHNQFQAGQLPQQWQEIQNTKRDITSPSFLAAANGDGAGAKGGNWQYLVQSVRFWWITQEYIRRQRRTYTSKMGLDLSSSEVRNYNDAGSILSAEQIWKCAIFWPISTFYIFAVMKSLMTI